MNIYILSPANVETGGPELLHQLNGKLIQAGLSSYIYYVGKKQQNPTPELYKKYNIKTTDNLIDSSENIMIVPETLTLMLNNYRNIKKVVWWQSIDNYYIRKLNIIGRINSIILNRFKSQKYFGFDNDLKNCFMHLVQSEYAYNHITSKNVNGKILYLSDYLNDEFLQSKTDNLQKKNIVLFNPKKGKKFTKKLIEYCDDIKFIPIENMSPSEVVELFKISKVYIDFGFHPGKDRIPREAAILNCCVITNKMGSAWFKSDLNIPDKYKFIESKKQMSFIRETIVNCFENFDNSLIDFNTYRSEILKQEEQFTHEIECLLEEIKK